MSIEELGDRIGNAITERRSSELTFVLDLTSQQKVVLREILERKAPSSLDQEALIEWAWSDDDGLAAAARQIILLYGAGPVKACFEKFVSDDSLTAPFCLEYNGAEHEFGIELPNVPGIGVSHYGRDDEATNKFLVVLERAYTKMNPDHQIQGFRA